MSRISKTLHVSPAIVNRVVKQCISAVNRREVYDASRKRFERGNLQRIKRGSVEEHLLSVYKEQHISYRACADLLNAMKTFELTKRPASPVTYVSTTGVYYAVQRMKHRKIKTESISQASHNNKHWQQARLNYYAQLVVRFGLPLPVVQPFKIEHVLVICDRRLLEKGHLMLSPFQIAWWDEIHLYQVIGCMQDSTLVFPRDSNGVYDPSPDGNYTEKKVVSSN